MRTFTSIFFVMALAASGCEKDMFVQPRRDSGSPPDAGNGGPLPLQPGMTFTYESLCTYRGEAAGMERNSRYALTVTITAVDDQGPDGPTALTFMATGSNTLDDDWDDTTDFDSWVARLGPARRADAVSGTPITDSIVDPPAIPPAPTPPKQLPRAGTFFMDVRQMEKIRADFVTNHQSQQPQTVDPAMGGRWQFAWRGRDETIFYYPDASKIRDINITYDPIGFLETLTETIGDASDPPSATCSLTRKSGP